MPPGTSFELSVEASPPGIRLVLAGPLTLQEIAHLSQELSRLDTVKDAIVDLTSVTRIDTAGAWVLAKLAQRVRKSGSTCTFEGLSSDGAILLDRISNSLPIPDEIPAAPPIWHRAIAGLGELAVEGGRFGAELLRYLGLFLSKLAGSILRPTSFKLTALVAHAEDVGIRAVPIVALMAFLIGVVLAFQGAAQLQQFGAEVFVVDLIAVSVLRELGMLLTAIIVAGRSASSFTAAIGSMKMREEIDAMRTLGLDPATVLFVPRILALVITLPILGLIADLMGLIGGALMAWIELGISPSMFRTRLLEGVHPNHLYVGLSKAPVFAIIIGVVGCHAGMQVKGNAESLGRMTSNAVVTAIFAVIVADALFSIFFAQVGI